MVSNRVAHVAKIRGNCYFYAVASDTKSDRVDRVVRDAKSVDLKVADRNSPAGFEQLNRWLHLVPDHRVGGRFSEVDRHAGFFRQDFKAADVIRMFVRNYDCVELGGILTDRSQPFVDLFAANPRVEQYAHLVRGDER